MNVKKIAAVVCAAWCAVAASAVDIETALQQVADQFSATFKKGTTIAIVGISSDSTEMSDFMLDDLSMRFVQARKVTVANRANLDAIKAEMNFQLSGEVSDESIQQLGAMVGASIVVHGKLIPIGSSFNLTVQALDVTSAAVVDMCRIRVDPNDTIKYLFSQSGVSWKKPSAIRSRYSGDVQLRMGVRVAGCGEATGVGFLLGVRNFNLFTLNDIFAVGFFEDLSGSLGSDLGINFVLGPAIGINIRDVVKLLIAPGLLLGMEAGGENGDSYNTGSPVGFALDVTAKFRPTKTISPFASMQFDIKGGQCTPHYGREYSAGLHGINIAGGITFNFGRRH
ncbi:MAG: hypothetical protein HDR38_07900 [Treponema sp.]|nr:hypothetical protein [Treponema sp.]